MRPHPLHCEVDDSQLFHLGQALWSWDNCTSSTKDRPCALPGCGLRHADKLKRYFQYYRGVVQTYVEASPLSSQLFQSHEDLLTAIVLLKEAPDVTHSTFQRKTCDGASKSAAPSENSRRATLLAVKVLTMVDCSALHHSSDRLETGDYRTHWKDHEPFTKYLQDLFPTTNHPVLSRGQSDLLVEFKSDIRATKLKKHLKINFVPTHDLRNHLRFNRFRNEVEIFHHTAFIKQQLSATKSVEGDLSISECLKLGALPRQLLLEVLDSIQGILFPLTDSKSRKLLDSLALTHDFDPDITIWEHSSIRNPGEETISYFYLADRLGELHDELHDPRPRGWLERRLQRKSGSRYMMMATLVGVIFAVVLGMLSLAVTCYQTWIAYQAWQHPVVLASNT